MVTRQSATATLYSGQVKLAVTYRDVGGYSDVTKRSGGGYKVVIETPVGRNVQTVGEPRILEYAVDSPEAFGEAARVAMSYAASDGVPIDEWAEHDQRTGGYKISRTSLRARKAKRGTKTDRRQSETRDTLRSIFAALKKLE